jgi:hypothetical protein
LTFRIETNKFIYILICISGVLQSAYTFYWQHTHVTIQATNAFLEMLWIVLSPKNLIDGNMRLSLLTFINLFFIIIFITLNKNKKLLIIIIFSLSALSIFSALTPVLNPQLINPIREFHSRTIIGFGSAVMMIFALIFNWYYLDKNYKIAKVLWMPLCIGIISASLWQLSNNFYWYKYLSFTKEIIESSSDGLVPYPNINSYLPNKLHEFSLGWGWTTFGIAIQGKKEVSNIFIPEGFPDWFLISKNPNVPIIIPFIEFDKGGLLDFNKLRSAIESQN